jgi:hypothetical protein
MFTDNVHDCLGGGDLQHVHRRADGQPAEEAGAVPSLALYLHLPQVEEAVS